MPLRASQERGWFSSLIDAPYNSEWWEHLEARLRSTRRSVTASLVAQMALAGIAFLFTVIASFDTELGDPSTALQIASGSLWIWLVSILMAYLYAVSLHLRRRLTDLQIPVIAGWITVGTQYSHHAIQDALEADGAVRALEPPTQPTHEYSEPIEQLGLVVRPGLTPQPHRVQTVVGAFDAPELARLELPNWLGATVGGDEQRKGPIYNYAKLFTWWQLASSIDSALFRTIDNVSRARACSSTHNQPQPQWDMGIPAPENLVGDSRGTAQYCGLDTQPILAYPAWGDIPSEIYKRIVVASVLALFLQWGTTGASIMIAYLTPTVGLGCRSGSYLLYGTLATVSWMCLLLSMLLSHEVMLRYQTVHVNNPSMDFRSRRNNPNQYKRTWTHALICASAVILRYIGKFLAFANTLWLIASSLLQFTGGFDNCWCKGDYLGMGEKGWIVLFKGANDLAATARLPWGGGLALTLGVCFVSYTFFFFGSLKTNDD